MSVQEDYIPRRFAERVMEGLSKKTIRNLRRAVKHPKDKVPSWSAELARPTASDVPPFSPGPTTLPGPGSFGPVSIGMHGHW